MLISRQVQYRQSCIYTTFKLSVSPWRVGGGDDDFIIEYCPEKREAIGGCGLGRLVGEA